MNCKICLHKIDRGSNQLLCTSCKCTFHSQCANITIANYRELSDKLRSIWQCDDCKNLSRRKRNNDDTPVRSSSATTTTAANTRINSDESIALCHGQTNKAAVDIPSISYDDFAKLLDSKLDSKLENIVESLSSKIVATIRQELKTTIDDLKSEFTETSDFIMKEQNDLKSQIIQQSKTIKELQSKNSALQESLQTINKKFTLIDDMSRSANLELHAVPERNDENVMAMFKNLCETTKIQLDNSAVRACRRVARMTRSDRPRNILVSLQSSRQRDEIISAVHRFNKNHANDKLNSNHLGVPGPACKVYVAEHLSPDNKLLYASARKAAKENAFKFVWVRYGKIYARKDETSTALLIRNNDSLKLLSIK